MFDNGDIIDGICGVLVFILFGLLLFLFFLFLVIYVEGRILFDGIVMVGGKVVDGIKGVLLVFILIIFVVVLEEDIVKEEVVNME